MKKRARMPATTSRNRLTAEPRAAGAAMSVVRRQERLRLQIFAEAARLFEENGGEAGGGFDKTTVEAIASGCDISTRTFFRYFESKVDVIYLDLRRSLSDYIELLQHHLEDGDAPLVAAVSARVEQVMKFAANPSNAGRLRRAFLSEAFKIRHGAWTSAWEPRVTEIFRPYFDDAGTATLRSQIVLRLTLSTSDVGVERWARGSEQSLLASLSDAYSTMLSLVDPRSVSAVLRRLDRYEEA